MEKQKDKIIRLGTLVDRLMVTKTLFETEYEVKKLERRGPEIKLSPLGK
jgi:hypothetical protein